jgi:hypothetical protein
MFQIDDTLEMCTQQVQSFAFTPSNKRCKKNNDVKTFLHYLYIPITPINDTQVEVNWMINIRISRVFVLIPFCLQIAKCIIELQK